MTVVPVPGALTLGLGLAIMTLGMAIVVGAAVTVLDQAAPCPGGISCSSPWGSLPAYFVVVGVIVFATGLGTALFGARRTKLSLYRELGLPPSD